MMELPKLQKFISYKDIGTEFYKAPELNKNGYNEKVDIWSVGTILFELLALPHQFAMNEKPLAERIDAFGDKYISGISHREYF